MTSLVAAPLLLPAISAAATLLFMRRQRWIAAGLSIASVAVLALIGIHLLRIADSGEIIVYGLGGWPAPFGILLVLDRLSALMVVLTALLALAVLCHAVLTGLDRRGWHFHPLFQFQLLGINGAFLTGDLFNLFVFFEVLLIASYGLMLHGQGAERLKAGVQYVIINLVGSTLFLFAVGVLYGVTGTLNMADMASRIGSLPASDLGLLRAGGLVLIVVFALKAALLPLHLWLPRTYARTSPAVAALFAVMTKVGVYAIIRAMTLIFGGAYGASLWTPVNWMLPGALATMAAGFAGLLAARRLNDLAAYSVIGSTGTLLAVVSLFEPGAMAAGLYYLPHTTLATALLFLVVDLVVRSRGEGGEAVLAGPRFAGLERLSLLYFLAAVAVAGLPPLSGFLGKLLILHATLPHPRAVWIWTAVLVTTLLALLGLARAGSAVFWKSAAIPARAPSATAEAPRWADLMPAAALVLLLCGLTIGAGRVTEFTGELARQIFTPTAYIDAVLGSDARD